MNNNIYVLLLVRKPHIKPRYFAQPMSQNSDAKALRFCFIVSRTALEPSWIIGVLLPMMILVLLPIFHVLLHDILKSQTQKIINIYKTNVHINI